MTLDPAIEAGFVLPHVVAGDSLKLAIGTGSRAAPSGALDLRFRSQKAAEVAFLDVQCAIAPSSKIGLQRQRRRVASGRISLRKVADRVAKFASGRRLPLDNRYRFGTRGSQVQILSPRLTISRAKGTVIRFYECGDPP